MIDPLIVVAQLAARDAEIERLNSANSKSWLAMEIMQKENTRLREALGVIAVAYPEHHAGKIARKALQDKDV